MFIIYNEIFNKKCVGLPEPMKFCKNILYSKIFIFSFLAKLSNKLIVVLEFISILKNAKDWDRASVNNSIVIKLASSSVSFRYKDDKHYSIV